MKKKLKLNDLEIQSFVTSLDKKDKDVLKGGLITDITFVNTGCLTVCISVRPLAC